MTPFELARTTLSNDQTFGVWSLIVTFFGDMAQGDNDRVSGTALTAVCEKLGIKPQAMRVALHRLRKDGWIDSVKMGRRSAYFLTQASREESAKASDRIYTNSTPTFSGLDILISPLKDVPDPWLSAGPEIFVSFRNGTKTPKNSIVTHYDGPVPDWLPKRLIAWDIVEGYQNFETRMQDITTDEWPQFSPHEIAAVRVLLVHNWRRLVLRHPVLPLEAFPGDCPIQECYSRFLRLLAQLPRPKLKSLE